MGGRGGGVSKQRIIGRIDLAAVPDSASEKDSILLADLLTAIFADHRREGLF